MHVLEGLLQRRERDVVGHRTLPRITTQIAVPMTMYATHSNAVCQAGHGLDIGGMYLLPGPRCKSQLEQCVPRSAYPLRVQDQRLVPQRGQRNRRRYAMLAPRAAARGRKIALLVPLITNQINANWTGIEDTNAVRKRIRLRRRSARAPEY
jgi:hypothetical protein